MNGDDLKEHVYELFDTEWFEGTCLEFKSAKGGLPKEMSDLRGEMSDLRGEMSDLRGEMSDLRGEMSDLAGGNVRPRREKCPTSEGEMLAFAELYRGSWLPVYEELCHIDVFDRLFANAAPDYEFDYVDISSVTAKSSK